MFQPLDPSLGRSVYIQSGKLAGARQFAAARLHSVVCELYRTRRGWQVDTQRIGRCVSIVLLLPRVYWLAFGLYHWALQWRLERVLRRQLADLGVDATVVLKVK